MESSQSLKPHSLKPGWICLTLAILLLLLLGPFFGSILASPLIIACFVLSIMAIVKNKVAGGVILLLLSFVLPPVAALASIYFSLAMRDVHPIKGDGGPIRHESTER